jgi:hypothetical protein
MPRGLNDGKNGVDWLNKLNKTADYEFIENINFLFNTR